ncbi:hypothetical protein HWV62_1777, partial [Athelia sp. TMB]
MVSAPSLRPIDHRRCTPTSPYFTHANRFPTVQPKLGMCEAMHKTRSGAALSPWDWTHRVVTSPPGFSLDTLVAAAVAAENDRVSATSHADAQGHHPQPIPHNPSQHAAHFPSGAQTPSAADTMHAPAATGAHASPTLSVPRGGGAHAQHAAELRLRPHASPAPTQPRAPLLAPSMPPFTPTPAAAEPPTPLAAPAAVAVSYAHAHSSEPANPPRKRKDRDPAPTNLAARTITFQRRTAVSTRPKERIERAILPSSPSTSKAAPEPSRSSPTRKLTSPQTLEADPEDFSRRLNISSTKRPSHTSPRPSHNTAKTKLFNPQTDPIPMRRTAEPEAASDATSSSYAPRGPSGSPNNCELSAHQRQLFDHRKDDPVRFSVMARSSSTTGGRPTPTPKSSADYVPASSTSSYAHSIASLSFTLSSGTTESSASSALFERRPSEETGNSNVFAVQLKKLYRGISSLETRILNEDVDDSAADEGRVLLKSHAKEVVDEDAEKQKWRKLIDDHKSH